MPNDQPHGPTAALWTDLDLNGITYLPWPGQARAVRVDSVRAPLAVRLARSVVKEAGGCWTWTGPTGSDGYPRFKVGGRATRLGRVVWEIAHGVDMPTDEVARHTCDRPLCLNPAHLVCGSHADNIRDRDERGRTSRGERHYAAKLTEGSVREIRRRAAAGATRKALALEYGVSPQLISRIVLRQVWAEVDDAA